MTDLPIDRLPLLDAAYLLHDEKRHDRDRSCLAERLVAAYLEASEADIADALRKAIKLDQDAFSNFDDFAPVTTAEAERVVGLARVSNPEFRQSTYDLLKLRINIAMR